MEATDSATEDIAAMVVPIEDDAPVDGIVDDNSIVLDEEAAIDIAIDGEATVGIAIEVGTTVDEGAEDWKAGVVEELDAPKALCAAQTFAFGENVLPVEPFR